MRKIMLITLAGLALTATACSKPAQDKTSADLKAAGTEVKEAAKDVVDTPEMKAVGADIKQGAAEAADKLKAAGADLKTGAQNAGDKLKSDSDTSSTTTSTTTVTKH